MLTPRPIVYIVQVVKNWAIRKRQKNVPEEVFYLVRLIFPIPTPSFAGALPNLAKKIRNIARITMKNVLAQLAKQTIV